MYLFFSFFNFSNVLGCVDQRVPEEINRKIVDHISDVNLTYSTYAENNLLREGLPRDLVIKVGSPLKEVYDHYSNKINKSKIIQKLGLNKKKYIVASIHREENLINQKVLDNILKSKTFFQKKKVSNNFFNTSQNIRKEKKRKK